MAGKRIAVSRARAQAGELMHSLEALGAEVFAFPTIEIVPVENIEDFGYVGDYQWVVFSSVNSVKIFFERIQAMGLGVRDFRDVKICAVGPATTAVLRERSLHVDAMPDKYLAEALMAELLEHEPNLQGKRVLWPRADIARRFLGEALREQGANVTELVLYRTVTPESPDDRADALITFAPDLLTFTSSSTVRNFCRMLGEERIEVLKNRAAFAVIGPITARTARELGIQPAIEAEEHSIPGLIQAIVEWAALP
ncbi:MAG: uroporphyrinogen-III synthase [Candidatus Hydrogenedentes bacterium]|nr:uroporphyrinogen-III synthase [Candidatus Hydrogenedentota bacterium]